MFLVNKYGYHAVRVGPFFLLCILAHFKIIAPGVFGLGIMVWAIYQYFIVLERRRQLYQHNIDTLTTEYEKSLANAKVEMHELAMAYISKEIHDNLKMQLAVANIHLTSMHTAADEGEKDQKIKAAVSMIKSVYERLGDITITMNTDIIGKEGLLPMLEKEIGNVKQTKLFELDFKVTGSNVLWSSERQLMTFRIIQELLQNIIKHANASSVSILLHYTTNTLELVVNDDGIGFDISQIEGSVGAGLANVRNRVKALQGKLNIHSEPAMGTVISISVPLQAPVTETRQSLKWHQEILRDIKEAFN